MGKVAGGALIVLGIIATLIGAVFVASYHSDHTDCENTLVRLLFHEKCQEADTYWMFGLISVIVGIVLLIVGAVVFPRL